MIYDKVLTLEWSMENLNSELWEENRIVSQNERNGRMYVCPVLKEFRYKHFDIFILYQLEVKWKL